MSESKFTPWHHASSPPARVGVYERGVISNSRWYSYWDGKFWCMGYHNPRTAYRIRNDGRSLNQGGYWRGLTKKAHDAARASAEVLK